MLDVGALRVEYSFSVRLCFVVVKWWCVRPPWFGTGRAGLGDMDAGVFFMKDDVILQVGGASSIPDERVRLEIV